MTKILYAGFGEIGIKGLSNLFSSFNYNPDNIYILINKDVDDLAMNYYIDKYKLNTISEEKIGNYKNLFDICLSVHWRKKISNEVISLCKNGGLNLHPSLLPKYAGCSSLAWAILNNEKYVGFSWHEITDNFDEGNIVLQESIKVDEFDTAFSLWNKVNDKGVSKILDILDLRLSHNYNSARQDLNQRTYYKRGFPTFEEALKINKNLDKKTYDRAKYFPGK